MAFAALAEADMLPAAVEEDQVLFREGRFTYQVLTPQHRDQAVAVLAQAFCTEPACSTVGKLHPELAPTYNDWLEFVDHFGDHCATNGLSVVAIDPVAHRVAGVFHVRDLFFFPPGFEETYHRDAKSLTSWMEFLWLLDAEAGKKIPLLAQARQGDFVDLWFLGVHSDYRGHGIANHLMCGALSLCKAAGFKYATIEATSAFTSKAAQYNRFTPAVSIEARDYLFRGRPVYAHCEPPHGTWTFWTKDLAEVSGAPAHTTPAMPH